MEQLLQYIFGALNLVDWVALFFFFMLGANIYQYVKVRQGIKKKPSSPNAFNAQHFFRDPQNWTDFIVSIVSAYLFVRFGSTLMPPELFGNMELLLLGAVGLGMSWQLLADKLIDKLRK